MLRADLSPNSQKQEYTLVVTLHHIASDGWSTSVMVKEVVELYNAIDPKHANLHAQATAYYNMPIMRSGREQYLTQGDPRAKN
jgi:NRPS condensation-like uncharacterized protein